VNPEETLSEAHKALGRAGYLLLLMLVKRRMRREYLVEAVEKVKFTTACLEQLLAALPERK
jgi:hypothetical protein